MPCFFFPLYVSFFSSASTFHPQPDVFGHVRREHKMQEGEEERKDSSEEIWLVLIWKCCFTSSEPNYWSELAVLRDQAQSHRSPDGQGAVGGSVTVSAVCTWTPGFSRAVAVLLCSRSEVLLLFFFYCCRRSSVSSDSRSFKTISLSLFCALFLAIVCLAHVYLLIKPKRQVHKKSKYVKTIRADVLL